MLKLERKENHDVNYEGRSSNLKWNISKSNSSLKKKENQEEVIQRYKDRSTLKHLLMKYIKLTGG